MLPDLHHTWFVGSCLWLPFFTPCRFWGSGWVKGVFCCTGRLIALFTRRLHIVGDKTQVSVGVFRGILLNAELGLERDSMRPPTLSWDSWVAQWRRPFQAAAARSMMFPVGN